MTRKEQLMNYVAAIDAEKAAWLVVKDRRPGSPFFPVDLWLRWREAARWRDAVGQTNSLLQRLSRQAPPPGYQSSCLPLAQRQSAEHGY